MEERVYKENLKRMILEMAQDEISNYSSQKGVQKYFEGNIDKIINENIKKQEPVEVKTNIAQENKKDENVENKSYVKSYEKKNTDKMGVCGRRV